MHPHAFFDQQGQVSPPLPPLCGAFEGCPAPSPRASLEVEGDDSGDVMRQIRGGEAGGEREAGRAQGEAHSSCGPARSLPRFPLVIAQQLQRGGGGWKAGTPPPPFPKL